MLKLKNSFVFLTMISTGFQIGNCYLTRSMRLYSIIGFSKSCRHSSNIIVTDTNPKHLICLSFYKFFNIENPEDFVNKARENFSQLDIKGTLYVATEGINGQFAIPDTKYSLFAQTISKIDTNLNDLDINIGEILPGLSKNPFNKLLIKVRDKILRDGLSSSFNWEDCGPEVEPEVWHNLISSKANDTILFGNYNIILTRYFDFLILIRLQKWLRI